MKLVLSDPKEKKSFSKEVQNDMFKGKKIRDRVKLDEIGLKGFEAIITGGSDKQGFPMKKDLNIVTRKKILLSNKPCFKRKEKGMRKKKTVRGNQVSEEIAQLNLKIIAGNTLLSEALGIKEKKTEKDEKEEKK